MYLHSELECNIRISQNIRSFCWKIRFLSTFVNDNRIPGHIKRRQKYAIFWSISMNGNRKCEGRLPNHRFFFHFISKQTSHKKTRFIKEQRKRRGRWNATKKAITKKKKRIQYFIINFNRIRISLVFSTRNVMFRTKNIHILFRRLVKITHLHIAFARERT